MTCLCTLAVLARNGRGDRCGRGLVDSVKREGRMRKLLIIFAITLLPSFAVAAGHGGGGGHMGGHMGSWSGGHMWGGHGMAMASGRMGSWHAANWHHAPFFHHRPFFHHARFFHRHHRFFFVGGPVFAFGYGSDCWRWVATAWGLRRIWVCGDYY